MAMWRPSGSGNLSNRRPMSSAAMNNNPQGVQQVMQPVAAPPSGISGDPYAYSNPKGPQFMQPVAAPAQTFAGSAAGRQPGMGMMSPPQSNQGARASDLRQQTSDSKWRMAQSAATPLAPTPSNPFFKPQGRDPQNPSQFAVQSVSPSSGNFVDRGGQTQPRLDTSMARNVMTGQPAEGSPSFGQPMNIPGATQTLGGNVVSPPQRYGQEGVVPGAFRGMTPAEGGMHGLSPDAFRVATGGQPMVPYVPSGTPATDGRTARQTTIANRNARARGVRGSDVAEWRATSPSSLIPQMNREQLQHQVATVAGQYAVAPVNQVPNQNAPTGSDDNYSGWDGQGGPLPETPPPLFDANGTPRSITGAPLPTPNGTPTQPGNDGVRRDVYGQPMYGLSDMPKGLGSMWRSLFRNPVPNRKPHNYGPKM